MKTALISLLFSLLASTSSAADRTIMEGVPASAYTMLVSTKTPRVFLDTTTYSGNVGSLGLFTSSNVVIGGLDKNIIYSTGSIKTDRIDASTAVASAVLISTTAYGGNLSALGLYVASNTVIGSQDKNILYSTGTARHDRVDASTFTASMAALISTTAYGGDLSALGLYVASNTVVGAQDSVVLYATGSIRGKDGTFSASGTTTYSVKTSSGISMAAGCINFSDASQTCTAPSAGASTSGNNTWTGINTFQSSVTFNGGIFGTINESTYTYLTTTLSTTDTTLGKCIANSTMTLTFGTAAALKFTQLATYDDTVIGDTCDMSFLIDGAYPGNRYSATVPVMSFTEAALSDIQNASYHYRTDTTVSAGAHSVCVTIATVSRTTGTCRLRCAQVLAGCKWTVEASR